MSRPSLRHRLQAVLFVFLIFAILPLTALAQTGTASGSEGSALDCDSFDEDLRTEMTEMMGATLAPWTHFLDEEQTKTADIKEGSLSFPASGHGWLRCIQKGDLLWAPKGMNGFLRRVVAINEEGDRMLFQTESAGFPDVILRGRVEVGTASREEAPREPLRDEKQGGQGSPDSDPSVEGDPSVEAARNRLQELGYQLGDEDFRLAVQSGPAEIVALYLEAGKDPNLTVDFIGAPTPVLLFAAGNGLVETTRLLLEAGADPNSAGKDGPLLAGKIADQPAIVRLFVKHGADLERPETMGLRPLHAAVYNGGYNQECVAESVRLLLEGGAHPDALTATSEGTSNPDGISPLMLAAQKGCPEAIDTLLDGGARASLAHASTGKTAADYAAGAGHDALAKTLRTAALSEDGPK